jgi:hypothetical protein
MFPVIQLAAMQSNKNTCAFDLDESVTTSDRFGG